MLAGLQMAGLGWLGCKWAVMLAGLQTIGYTLFAVTVVWSIEYDPEQLK